MKKNGKILILVILILIIVLLVFVGFRFLKNDTKSTEKLFYDYPKEERKTIKICKDDTCSMPINDNYEQLVIDSKYPKLDKKVKEINKKTLKYYEEVKKSTVEGEECANVKDTYYHRMRVSSIYYNYENDKYVSIGVQRKKYDLCTGSFENKDFDVYIYDKKDNKLLTQDEFRVKEKISTDEIKKAIDASMEIIREENDSTTELQGSYDDAFFLYGYNGDLYVAFHVLGDELYYTGTLRTA